MTSTDEVTSLPLIELVKLINEPNRSACYLLLEHYSETLARVQASRAKHQVWPGGLHDHLTEVMNFAKLNYELDQRIGRLRTLPMELQYSLSDVLLCCFVHDLDKLAKYAPEAWPLKTSCGPLETKSERKYAQQLLLEFYGFSLRPAHSVALQFAEGVRDSDYSPKIQLMTPLSFAVHSADLKSAVWGNYPLAADDPFKGARRIAQP